MVTAKAVPIGFSSRRDLQQILRKLPPQLTIVVVLYGSVARRDDTGQSDLDVLVVVRDVQARRAVLDALVECDVAVTVQSLNDLMDERSARPSFVAHLLDEGIAVFGGEAWNELRGSLHGRATDLQAIDREIAARASALNDFKDLDRFAASPVTLLSHLYSITRSTMIAKLLRMGIHEYSWTRVFDRYAELFPETRDEVEKVKSMRPFYEYARARTSEPPREAVDKERMCDLVRAAEQLVQ